MKHFKSTTILGFSLLFLFQFFMLSCEQKSEKCKCRESYCQASKYESEDYLHVIFFDAVPETYSGIVVICDNDGFILEQVEFLPFAH